MICQKRQGDTNGQGLYKGVSLEYTKLKTEGTNTEKTQLQKPRKNTYTYKLITTKQQLGET